MGFPLSTLPIPPLQREGIYKPDTSDFNHIGGFLLCHSVACSYVYAMRISVASSNGFPISCIPIGNPEFVNPHGTEIPGRPARFTGIVNMSDKYMVKGSASFSPNLNGGVGITGVIIASHCLNASKKSCFISVLTFCA